MSDVEWWIEPEKRKKMSEQAGREMTLEEWVDRLPPEHRAKNELAALKRENKGMKKLLNEMGVDSYLQQKADDVPLTAEESE